MNYQYQYDGKTLKVYIDKSFMLKVSNEGNGNYSFGNSTKPFNPLSGLTKQSLIQILIIHSIIAVLAFFAVQFLYFSKLTDYNFAAILIIYFALLFGWFFYYLIRFEFLKWKIEKLLFDDKIT